MQAGFSHEKLQVYQRARQFLAERDILLRGVKRVAACEHLERAGESILLNIARAAAAWSPKDRIVCLGQANGSSLECAACLDVLAAKTLLTKAAVRPGKSLLREIVNMLIAWKSTASRLLREASEEYGPTREAPMFDHEKLDVYRLALDFAGWIEKSASGMECSREALRKLDNVSTSIVLNIAEGNGRFSRADRKRFVTAARTSAVQAASLLDAAKGSHSLCNGKYAEAQASLRRIAAMLTALHHSLSK